MFFCGQVSGRMGEKLLRKEQRLGEDNVTLLCQLVVTDVLKKKMKKFKLL